MPASHKGGKVPKLIVRDVFRNILRYCWLKKTKLGGLDLPSSCMGGEYPSHWIIEASNYI
jgi:hypothetical protein